MLDVATIFAGSLESIEMIHVYFGGTRLSKMREEMFHGGAQKWGHLEFLSPPAPPLPHHPTLPPSFLQFPQTLPHVTVVVLAVSTLCMLHAIVLIAGKQESMQVSDALCGIELPKMDEGMVHLD